VDPLTDVAGCTRDIPNLLELRTNTIRVYSIDPTGNHDQCMAMLQNAGIYVIADLSSPDVSINRDDPAWTPDLYSRYTSVIDSLAKYNNVIGFFAGNEVTNHPESSDAIPFVKAAVRDTKAYIVAKSYRPMGVGYAADDDPTIRVNLENYVNCGPRSESVDFFGYNVYSWCGASDFVTSHYQARTEEFANYSVPVFFAEYGCVTETRLFTDTLALYSSNMTGVWSGGIVFEYFQAPNDYGMLAILPALELTLTHETLGLVTLSGSTVSKLPDFSVLSTQIAKVTPVGVNAASYTPTNTAARTCPPTASDWEAAASPLPPTPNEQLCGCMVQNLTCVVKGTPSDAVIGTLFNVTCNPSNGANICDGIQHDGATGQYGAYSMCSPTEQLSWAMNAYYQEQLVQNSANTQACDFAGNATTQTPTAPSGTCASLLSQAGGAVGTGQVTAIPSPGTNTGSGSSTSAASSTGAAMGLTVPNFDFVLLKLGAYVTVAVMAGAGMILL
jgi:hypothetical protein